MQKPEEKYSIHIQSQYNTGKMKGRVVADEVIED
jgi:hypothetical protein